jgi:hypothetical protein
MSLEIGCLYEFMCYDSNTPEEQRFFALVLKETKSNHYDLLWNDGEIWKQSYQGDRGFRKKIC